MRSKITSLLTLLFVALFSLPAMAQLDELKLKAVDYEEAAETMTPDTEWYLVFNKRNGGGYWADDNCSERRVRMSNGIDVVTTGDEATRKALYLVRFISTELEGIYKIQFGTGNWMTEELFTSSDPEKAALFNVYNINDEPGNFGVNVADFQARVDNNGKGNDLSPWDTGKITQSGGNNTWTIYPVTLTDMDERTSLLNTAGEYVDKYDAYLTGDKKLDIGTEVGQYDITQEEYDAWLAHIQNVFDFATGENDELTNEEIKAEFKAIDDGWAYFMSKEVKLVVNSGNYRIVSTFSWTNTTTVPKVDADGNEYTEEVTTHPTKAMYATLDPMQVKWANLDSTDCRFLWHLEKIDENVFKVKNLATDGIINYIDKGKTATLAKESDMNMEFLLIRRTDDGRVVISFRKIGGGQHSYTHCGGHNNGAGVSGNVVGWQPWTGESQWILDPVDDETVNRLVEEYAPFKDHEKMVKRYERLIATGDSAMAAAKNDAFTVTYGEGILNRGEQFSSPFTCTEAQEGPQGSSFNNLFDGNDNTYWHSSWASSVPGHTHWFQVTLDEPIAEGAQIQAYIKRRNAANDHITAMTVYGSNDEASLADESEASWTRIDSLNTPWYNGQADVRSELVTTLGGYKYLRFYIDNTAGSGIKSTRGYAHMARFQLYPAVRDGKTQFSQMGDVATTLEAELQKAHELDTEELTKENLIALEGAVNAFLEKLVNIDNLVSTINNKKSAADIIVLGNNPGQWTEGAGGGALSALIAEANAYLKAGIFTQEKVDEYAANITETADNILASANKVQTGKWYSFRYDSEENYDKYGWDKGNTNDNNIGAFFNNVLATADEVTVDETKKLVTPLSLNEIAIGQNLRFVDPTTVLDTYDQASFRFIAAGDSAYYIQHKSGLYVGVGARSEWITLGIKPGLFDVKAVGLGKCVIHARSIDGKELYDEPVYLHAARSGHSLVTWNADGINTNSAFFIEEVEDQEGETMPETAKLKIMPNSMQFWCYGIGYKPSLGEIFEYQGASINDTEISLAFNKIEAAKPGQPVLYINGDTKSFDKEVEKEAEELTLSNEPFAAEPDTINGIHGTYAYKWVDEYKNVVVAGGNFGQEGNHFEEAAGMKGFKSTRDVSANTAYIVPAENTIENFNAEDYDLVFTLTRDPNAIEKVTTVLNNRNDIYTIDGKLVKKNGTISDVRAMGRGLYIIGGVKVMVK